MLTLSMPFPTLSECANSSIPQLQKSMLTLLALSRSQAVRELVPLLQHGLTILAIFLPSVCV